MEGRHVHPSTLYPGGVGTVPTIQLFTDYLVRLMKYVEFMKKVVPLHDDLFDFFYEALPGYEKVGQRRVLLGCWGSFNDPGACDYTYRHMSEWGRAMFVTPSVIVDGKVVTNNLVDINLGIRILLGSSYYDDWQNAETFVKTDPLGNPVDQRHPWNQTTTPRPRKRDFNDKYTWVMSPRWFDKRTGDHLPLDTGGGPLARFWATALAGLVDIGYIKATGHSVKIYLPQTALKPEMELEWHIPRWSNAIERDRARSYFQAYAAAAALHFAEKALAELHAGRTKGWAEFTVPDEAIGCGFHEAVRGVLSHHVVIREDAAHRLVEAAADGLVGHGKLGPDLRAPGVQFGQRLLGEVQGRRRRIGLEVATGAVALDGIAPARDVPLQFHFRLEGRLRQVNLDAVAGGLDVADVHQAGQGGGPE